MKMLIGCTECGVENHDIAAALTWAEIRDDGMYEMVCSKGHKIMAWNQSQKFELLFDLGLMAFLDGYTRESVATVATSLERFYEFCIQYFLADLNIAMDQFVSTWKLLQKQSERQIGAFLMLCLAKLKSAPPFLSSAKIEFRNNVVHKGYIPSSDEAEGYIRDVLAHIQEVLNQISAIDSDMFRRTLKFNSERNKKMKEGHMLTAMDISTSISISRHKAHTRSFEECLSLVKSQKGIIYKP
jgi:hypothetical protein